MSPDDARHGTYRGWSAHDRAGEPPCDPCLEARRTYQRNRPQLIALGKPMRCEIGEKGHTITLELADLTEREWRDLTGTSPVTRKRILAGGAATTVRRTTRERLEATTVTKVRAKRITNLGCTRRVQALARLGHSATALASIAGLHPATMRKIQRGELAYVEYRTRKLIDKVYRSLEHTPCLPVTNITARTFRLAERHRWAAPAAWDDIDNPTERPSGIRVNARPVTDVDPVVVERFLAGDTYLHVTRAERREVAARWPGSDGELQRITGWNLARDRRRDGAA